MKIIKIALLFYNSILIFSLVTIGFVTGSYQELSPVLLLLPVGIYFNLTLVNQLTKFAHLVKNPKISKLRRALRFYSLVISLLFVSASLISLSSFSQFLIAMVFFPLVVWFWLDLFNKTTRAEFILNKKIALTKLLSSMKKVAKPSKKKAKKIIPKAKEAEILNQTIDVDGEEDFYNSDENIEKGLVTEGLEDMLDVKDQKRRQFLRIVGGGGVSLFLTLFVFQKKAGAAFFGSAPGPGVIGIKDIAGDKIDPAEKQPTDGYNVSEIDDSNSPAYYGFLHKEGAWYIAKEDSSGAYRYISGASGFTTNWTNRVGLSYDYFDNIF